MFRCQRGSKPLLFRSRILLPNQLQHLPPEFLGLRAVRTSSRAAVLQPFGSFFPRCGAATLWLLLRDSAPSVSAPADNSALTSSLRLPTSASRLSLAPEPLLGEVLSCSSLSSSTGPPQEVAV